MGRAKKAESESAGSPSAGAARVAEIDTMIRDAMKQLRDRVVSPAVIYPHVGALEAEKAELEERRVEFLAASNLVVKGPLTTDQWEALDMAQKHTFMSALLEVVIIKPATKRGNQFDPERILYVWRESA